MEEKRRDAPSSAVDSPASEPASSRRRAGGNKRKASALNASNSSSTPSKRTSRDKASPLHPPPLHNGPLTRARQTPNNLSAAAVAGSASAPAAVKHSERAALIQASGADSVALAEQLKKESEWETLEAAIEAEFEAIRSRGTNAHVVPTHCGWFSWSCIHPIEKQALPSFFNGKTENRTPDVYMEIRNWIMKKFHSNPNVQIELKDISELNVGDLDARQEIMEFLDYWGLINFHPFPSMDSAVASASEDGEAEKISLLEKLYRFETLQLCPPVVQKSSQMTSSVSSGLFPESAIAEELVKQEGPAVEMLEYHCNSCSADCSRKRYHCQKQADFDLCTDCFSNRRFGSGMSSLDFILMEPAEVAGVNGGKWTDQETLLLLEALELYKENWNEIAEHVGTKSKTQCILHFVQMPIEDAFVDCDDNVDADCKETADPASANNNSSMDKDATEIVENDSSDGIKGHDETSKAEDVKANVNHEEIPKLHGGDEKTSEGTTKSEDAVIVKSDQEAGNDCALNALKEAFTAVGYSPEGPSSFAEVGNPVMALAAFLAHLVGSDVAVASAHSSIKSMSGNSSGTELAARYCFLLEDPPDNKKESTSSERDSKSEGDQDEVNVKQDKPVLDDKDLPNDHDNMKIESNALEDKGQLASTDDGASGKPISSKEQAMINHESGLDNCNDPNSAKLPNDQAPGTLHSSGGSTSKAEIPPSSDEVQEGTLIEEPSRSVEELKDRCVSDPLLSEKKELHQSIKSNIPGEHPKPVETPKSAAMVSDSIPSAKNKPQNLQSINPVGGSLESTDSVMDVDGVTNSLQSEKIDSQPLITPKGSQCNGTEKDVDMVSPPVRSSYGPENGANTGAGGDHAENGTKVKDDGTKTKQDSNFEKVKRAAVSTLAAAAVKAKLLASQEEDQIRQLTSLLIEKQLHKLETKLAFFNDAENVVMRAREHVERSRHKLYHERALIIASRLGLPASSSRGAPSVPTNRIPMNVANSLPRPQIMMNPQRPLISRPVGTVANTLQNPLASATAAGNSVRPSSQENLSSVGTK
ncbi:SWI/SNF complex subunit SWI3D-like [Abrus precatorius]|uniref:SWI/SNF complex subunit SWI3D-like n=1 Tax=Abrus precatorius TaxID=3816 RepID=A0A8B8LM90_ABRPR|nr:SWI/SNF complex subunit SWI3D-like [Abrus precatorius]